MTVEVIEQVYYYLENINNRMKMQQCRIGYITGVFDIFCAEHLSVLKAAKKQCGFLVVGVATDELIFSYMRRNPVIPFEERKSIVESIKYVDKVVPQITLNKVGALDSLRYDVVFFDSDIRNRSEHNIMLDELKARNTEIVFLSHTDPIIEDELLRGSVQTKKGYTTGVFDLFHIGHLNIFRRAKEQCDFLIVGVSTDELVIQEKVKKPVFSFEERYKIVSAVRYVDKVVPQKTMNKLEAYFAYRFDRVFVGDDWKGTDRWKKIEKNFHRYNVDVIYLPRTSGVSSTKLNQMINKKTDNSEYSNENSFYFF
jgi:glycerol-3-phosphate cytidylyltransferase